PSFVTFLFNHPPTTTIYTLSLHDALPIYPKKTRSLPTILSQEEVAQLLRAARTPCERILLMALYATGARRSELTHLKVSDIDSRSEEHTSELQSLAYLVCRLLLEKKKKN